LLSFLCVTLEVPVNLPNVCGEKERGATKLLHSICVVTTPNVKNIVLPNQDESLNLDHCEAIIVFGDSSLGQLVCRGTMFWDLMFQHLGNLNANLSGKTVVPLLGLIQKHQRADLTVPKTGLLVGSSAQNVCL